MSIASKLAHNRAQRLQRVLTADATLEPPAFGWCRRMAAEHDTSLPDDTEETRFARLLAAVKPLARPTKAAP